MSATNINVIKRDGTRVPLDLSRIQAQIARACFGISDVSPSMIEMEARIQFHDGMTTENIDNLLLRAMVDLINVERRPDEGHTNYQFVAGRQRLMMLRKSVYGQYEVPRLFDIVNKVIAAGLYTPELLDWYTEEEWDTIDSFVDHRKDEKYSFAAIEQLNDKYLVRNRATNEIYETPQVRYIVAAATAFHMEANNRLQYVKDYYNTASDGYFTLATPVLAGLGTPTRQFSSCVLLTTNDSLKSIFATGEMMAAYAAKRAGIGMEVGKLRRLGAPIRGGEIKHTGMLPFLKKFFYDLRSCSQGGIRNASATITFPLWHWQFDDLIVLRNNQGTDETRIRQLDYCVALNAFFWRRYQEEGIISFFDPAEVPDLYDAFYANTALFEKLYVQYENDPKISKKQERAVVVFENWLLKERTDTGRIYLLYTDNVISQTPFDVSQHPIVQSNLCVEILLPTKTFERVEDESGRIALCTLGSNSWAAYRRPEDMRGAMRILVRALHNVLGYQDFLSIQSKLSNDEFEPLGIGVTNLAFWHAKKGYRYGEPEALAEVKRWMEHQAFYLTEASVDLAEEKGPCGLSHTTWYGKGVFPWERRAKGVNELTDFTPSLDWEPLRAKMLKYGIRNATLLAVAPVESSSVVIDSTNGIEMPMALISTKESKGSSLTQVVPQYNKYKNKYQLMWDQTDCVDYIKTAAVLKAYCDQSISTNTFYSPKYFEDGKIPTQLIATNLMLGHKWGLATFYYSLIEKQGSTANEEQPHVGLVPSTPVEEDDDYCEACVL